MILRTFSIASAQLSGASMPGWRHSTHFTNSMNSLCRHGQNKKPNRTSKAIAPSSQPAMSHREKRPQISLIFPRSFNPAYPSFTLFRRTSCEPSRRAYS